MPPTASAHASAKCSWAALLAAYRLRGRSGVDALDRLHATPERQGLVGDDVLLGAIDLALTGFRFAHIGVTATHADVLGFIAAEVVRKAR